MSHHAYEFIVEGFVEGERFYVIGRNGDEDLQIGGTFDAMYRYRPRRSLEDRALDPIRECERPVSLRITGIRALNRDLQHLGVGMTAAIAVEGEGIEDIAPGWVLGRASVAHNSNGAAAGSVVTTSRA